jgi:hypothetical protein
MYDQPGDDEAVCGECGSEYNIEWIKDDQCKDEFSPFCEDCIQDQNVPSWAKNKIAVLQGFNEKYKQEISELKAENEKLSEGIREIIDIGWNDLISIEHLQQLESLLKK